MDRTDPARRRQLAAIHGLAGQLTATLPELLHQLREGLAAHPQAQAYDRDPTGQPPWCWTHEQDVTACHRDGRNCNGETLGGPNDPTGNAAVSDPAQHDLAATDRDLDQAYAALDRIHARAHRWAPAPPPKKTNTDQRDPMWCKSCWRDGAYHEPVDPDRYPGAQLCRWCGDFHGAHHRLPPLQLVEKRRLGKRVTQADIDEALHPKAKRKKTTRR